MEKERSKIGNESYFYRLNQELGGAKDLTPYFISSGMPDAETETTTFKPDAELTGLAGEDI